MNITYAGKTVHLESNIGVMDLIAALRQSARIAGEEGFANVQKRCDDAADELDRGFNQARRWPPPTTDKPDIETLEGWMSDSGCEATDGCWVEPDGECEHGHPSWMIRIGLI
jgi:hypothetical protein